MKLGWVVPWDVNMCTCYFNWGDLKMLKLFRGDLWGISIGKQLNFHCVSFDNVGGAFVSFDTFLVSFWGDLMGKCPPPNHFFDIHI